MSLATVAFGNLGGSAFDALDWSSGQKRIIQDITTGDWLWWKWTSADNKMPLYSSQDNGATWSLVVADASGASGSQPNWIQAVIQDATNGNVHCVSSGSSNVYTYTRFSLTRSGGHVTGYSIDRAAYSLPTHSFDASSDRRADINIWVDDGGAEQVVICFQGGTTAGPNTDLQVYMCKMSALTGTNTAVGMDGSGNDTLVYSHSTGGVITNHVYQALLGQEKTNKRGYCVIGQMNTDYAQSVSASSDYDLFAIPFTVSSGVWTQQTAIVVHSVPGAGGTMPQLLTVQGVAGGLWIMYYGENGIAFAKINSSNSLTDRIITEPYTTGTRSAFGSFVTDGTNVLAIYNTFGSVGGSPAGEYAYYNGSSWTKSTATAAGTEAWFSCQNTGSSLILVAGAGRGSTLAQTRTADAAAAMSIYTLTQTSYRPRNDDGSETTATWAGTQDSAFTFPKDTNLRLRFLMDATGAPALTYQLESKLSSESLYLKTPTSATSSIASVGTMGTGTSSTSTTTITTTTTTNALSPGDTCILVVAADNTSTTNGDNSEVSSVSDSASNTWTKLAEYTNGQGAAAAGSTVSVWMCYATAALPIGSTVTVTFGSARVDKTTSLWKFTSNRKLVQSTTSQFNTVNAGNGFGSNTFSGLASKQRLYFMGGSKEANSTTAITVSTGFTTITAQRSRNNAAAQLVRGEFRINTSTGETSNPTLAVTGDAASVFVALEESPPPILISTSSNISASAADTTTSQLTGGSGSFTAGRVSDDTNPLPSITIGSGNTEVEFNVQALSANGVSDAQVYNLRITAAGIAADTYTNTPAWTIGAVAGGNTIAVQAGSLSLTGQVPTIATTANQTVSVPAGSLTLTGLAPSILTPNTVSVPAGSLSLTGLVPTVQVTANVTVSVPAGSLSMTGQIPTVTATANQLIAVPAGNLSLTGLAPTINVSGSVTINVPAGALTINGLTPTITATANQLVDVPAGSLTLTGNAPAVLSGISVVVPAGSLSLTGQAPTVNVTQNVVIDVPAASLTLSALAPIVVGPDEDIGGDVPRRRTKRNVIRGGKYIQETIPNGPFSQAPKSSEIYLKAPPSAPQQTVQTAQDEDIVAATAILMMHLM